MCWTAYGDHLIKRKGARMSYLRRIGGFFAAMNQAIGGSSSDLHHGRLGRMEADDRTRSAKNKKAMMGRNFDPPQRNELLKASGR